MESDSSARTGRDGESTAAVKLQKVYRSYRTRRRLADSAVVAEELWWQAIDYARLNYSTVSFFDYQKSETAASRWSRISLVASKIGKGLCEDSNANKLAFQHWIEAIDPRHRYGHNLQYYYEEWCNRDSPQPFFYWLDVGDGKGVEAEECPRSRLRQDCIRYLGPQEREYYEYTIRDGMIWHKLTGNPLNTERGMQSEKWIFVLSTCKKLYIGKKEKGTFHHSSFLAGGATLAAGRLVAEHGKIKSISAYSGHYRPTDENLSTFTAFLEDSGVSLDNVMIMSRTMDKTRTFENNQRFERIEDQHPESHGFEVLNRTKTYRRSITSNSVPSPGTTCPESEILKRIKSKRETGSYLSVRWSTGVGPRIGCIADYPVKLRVHAMGSVHLSTPSEPAHVSSPKSFCRIM